jgi:hypothetical protein
MGGSFLPVSGIRKASFPLASNKKAAHFGRHEKSHPCGWLDSLVMLYR